MGISRPETDCQYVVKFTLGSNFVNYIYVANKVIFRFTDSSKGSLKEHTSTCEQD